MNDIWQQNTHVWSALIEAACLVQSWRFKKPDWRQCHYTKSCLLRISNTFIWIIMILRWLWTVQNLHMYFVQTNCFLSPLCWNSEWGYMLNWWLSLMVWTYLHRMAFSGLFCFHFSSTQKHYKNITIDDLRWLLKNHAWAQFQNMQQQVDLECEASHCQAG